MNGPAWIQKPFKAGWYWVITDKDFVKIEHVWQAGPRESADYLAVGNERISKGKSGIKWFFGPIPYPESGPPPHPKESP